MHLVKRLKNGLRGIIQRHGTLRLKTWLWNREFSSGYWSCLDETPDDPIYGFLERYARGGAILDLGCGAGNTANELRVSTYDRYVGVDISAAALAKAQMRSEQNGRASKNHYLIGEIMTHVPDTSFDVILFRESLFYVPAGKILAMLSRLAGSLKQDGVFLVRMTDRLGYAEHCNVIETHFNVVEKFAPPRQKTIILAFR